MKSLSITAMHEGTGKTAIAIAIGLLAKERGLSVGYMKPKGTRLESHVGKIVDRDPLLAAELLEIDDSLEVMEPIVYSPTFVENAVRGQEEPDELRGTIETAFEELATDRDLMILEGAGHLEMGWIVGLTDAAIARTLDAQSLLVAEFSQFGDLDGILGATSELDDALAGLLFNRVREDGIDRLERDAIPFLERRGHPVVGVIPHDRELAGVTVNHLAEELGARRLTDAGDDAFVERFIVGAMGAETALRQFRRMRHAAVITGGDRSEIHAAAIEASGVTCLVVTGGIRPAERILTRAARADLAVLALDADTLSAVERAEEIVRSGRTRDRETVRRMVEYLNEHADLDMLLTPP